MRSCRTRRRLASVVLGIAATAVTGAGLSVLASPATAANVATPGSFTGYGFDQCVTPTQQKMDAWLTSSPFWAVGIYISGDSRGCPVQPNLTPAWVSTQLRAGWRLLPLTVGPQASCTTVDRYRSQVRINPRSTSGYAAARLQGRQEAVKTVAAARALGISARSTLWYDIESYDTSITSCRESALSFLSAWTKKLHSLGYVSGVYSSAGTGISALDRADAATPGKYAMPDQVWHARWDGVASTASTYFRPTSWMPHRRVHQYLGDHNETHGGVTINIDSNYLDLGRGSVAPAPRASCGVKIDFATYPTLQLGDTRSEAAAAQCLLKNKGFYAAAVGGALDATTMAALNAFQRNRALPVTSSLTGSAWTALLADGRQSVLKQGSASHGVRRAQRALNAALGARPLFGGPPVPALVVDGVFGASTTTAVRLYQQRTGVPVTGVLAADTWEELSIGSW